MELAEMTQKAWGTYPRISRVRTAILILGWFGVVFGTWGGGAGSAVEPAMAPLERHVRDSMRVAGVDDAALRRVIALGDVVESGGVRVELIALEIREEGRSRKPGLTR
jgi:hypothetical protein